MKKEGSKIQGWGKGESPRWLFLETLLTSRSVLLAFVVLGKATLMSAQGSGDTDMSSAQLERSRALRISRVQVEVGLREERSPTCIFQPWSVVGGVGLSWGVR